VGCEIQVIKWLLKWERMSISLKLYIIYLTSMIIIVIKWEVTYVSCVFYLFLLLEKYVFLLCVYVYRYLLY